MKALTLPLLATLLAFATFPAPLQAQNQAQNQAEETDEETDEKSGDAEGPRRFWQASLSGGHYMVALDRISSVSRHSYVLDGAVLVDEVTVDTVGQALARFYFLQPVTAAVPGNAAAQLTQRGKELLDQAGRSAGTDVHNMVMKKYPETTHSKTIEYRLLSEQQLSGLYGSLRSAWESGRGRIYTAR